MLNPAVVQLNAGTCSPTPRMVFDHVTELRRQQAESPTEFQWRGAWGLLNKSREALGAYVNADPRDLALVENVTVAINIVAQSLRLPPGSQIVTSNHEYGSMLKLWQRLATERDWAVTIVPLPETIDEPSQVEQSIAAAFTDRTKVLFFSHISSPSGLIFPVEALCRAARERGIITVIDGAHAPGQVPLDLKALDADFYCANCHKWMMAPASVGFLHANRRGKHGLRSTVSSWGHGYAEGTAEAEVYPGTTNWHYDLEFHGTSDRTPQMVLPETTAFRQEIGGDAAVVERVRELTAHLRTRLGDIGLHAWLRHDSRLVGTLTTFTLPEPMQSPGGGFIAAPADSPAQRLQRRLWERHRIEVPATFFAGRAFLRVSTAWFNTQDEVDRLADALRAELT